MVTQMLSVILRIDTNEPIIPRITRDEVSRLLALSGHTTKPSYVEIPEKLGSGNLIRPPGRSITPTELEILRVKVLEDLAAAGFELGFKITSSDHKANWDKALGASLLKHLPISAAQASENGVWAYLSTFVFWDFASWRYSSARKSSPSTDNGGDEVVKSIERSLGGQRNVLRKCWIRAYVLGPNLGVGSELPLAEAMKEDELVNLFERSTLGDDHELARAIARTIYKHHPKAARRMDFTRELTKSVLRKTVSTHFSYLGSSMDDLLDEIAIASMSSV
jgi:hypothetical protein